MPVAHTYNPSYSGGRDQEDHSQSHLGQIVLKTLSQKALHKNRAGGVAQGEGPEFKDQYPPPKKRYGLCQLELWRTVQGRKGRNF
jgi:hypothetical protein